VFSHKTTGTGTTRTDTATGPEIKVETETEIDMAVVTAVTGMAVIATMITGNSQFF